MHGGHWKNPYKKTIDHKTRLQGTPIFRLPCSLILNVELTPEFYHEKLSRLDVYGILPDGTRIDIEVQVIHEHNMAIRTLFYWARMFFAEMQQGATYSALRPAITINIVAFGFLENPAPHSEFNVREKTTGELLTNALEIHFLEVPKCKKKPLREMTKMERWLAYFANKIEQQEKEELVMQHHAIAEALNEAQLFLMSEEDQMRYLNRQMAIWDENSRLETSWKDGVAHGIEQGREQGRAQGIEQGRAQGIEQGRDEQACTIARSLLADGSLSLEKISAITGLSTEKLKQLS